MCCCWERVCAIPPPAGTRCCTVIPARSAARCACGVGRAARSTSTISICRARRGCASRGILWTRTWAEMTGALDTVSGLLGRRLLTTTWIPVFAFLALAGVLVCSATRWSTTLAAWQSLPADLRGLVIVLFAAATMLLTQLLAACRPGLIQLYEGYWDGIPLLRRLTAWCVRRLDTPSIRDSRPWTLPTPTTMLPTRFGNVIRAAEQEARRYG